MLALQRSAVDIFEFGPQIRNRFGNSASDLFVYSPAIDVGQSLVDPDDPEVVIDQLEADRRRVSDGFKKTERLHSLLLRLAQRQLQAPLVVDVGRRSDPEVDSAIGAAHRLGTEGMPAVHPIESTEPTIDGVVRPRGNCLVPSPLGQILVIRMSRAKPSALTVMSQ